MLGEAGEELWELAHGHDERPVIPDAEAKSLGAETTFDEDTGDAEVVRNTLLELSDRVAARLRAQGLLASGATLKFRDEDFRTVTRSGTLARPSDLAEDLFGLAVACLQRLGWKGKPVRLLGVTANRLRPAGSAPPVQPDLFAEPEPTAKGRLRKVAFTVDEIRRRFGADAIARAALVRCRDKEEE
jgi:DNA polymerase-4